MENEKATILWDSPIITDRHAPCNKPDIIIQEIIGATVIADKNIKMYLNS